MKTILATAIKLLLSFLNFFFEIWNFYCIMENNQTSAESRDLGLHKKKN